MPTRTKPTKAKRKGTAVVAAQEKAGYRPLWMDSLPSGWQGRSLREFGVFVKGKGILKTDLVDLGLPCVTYGELYTKHHFVIDRFYSFIPPKLTDGSTRLEQNDILFAGSGETAAEIGKCAAFIGDEEAYAGGDVVIFRQTEIDAQYLALVLNSASLVHQRARLGQGHSVVHIYPDLLAEQIVPIAPKHEQRRIAAILSTWDKALSTLAALIAAKQRRQRGLMQDLLSGKRRFPGFKGKWKEVRLDKAFDFLRTTSHSRADLTRDPAQGAVAYIHYGDIHATYTTPILDLATNRNVPRLLNTVALNGNTDYLRDGDLVIADASEDYEGVGSSIELNNVGKRKVIAGLHTLALRDKSGLTVPGFRAYMLREPIVANRMRTLATGSKVYGISKTNLAQLMLLLPSPEEQQRILMALNAMDSEIAHLTDQHTHLTTQKRGLMQQLMTGKVRVKS